MRLSNLADYAVVLLCAAARAGEVRLNATCLAAETGVPLPTAQKLIGKLSGAGLLVSARGGNGGFRLARTPAQITLADIVEAVEGPIALTACVEAGRQDCGLDHHCQVKPHWDVVNDAMRGALASVTLAQLATPTPFVPSAVEGRAPSAKVERASTSLDTNGLLEARV
ncbi:FeS assembly SUF system regulator [Sphingomonas vulcanisoli]|uniref:FeS assembly SUF system regulator n=1 Tax=Sphingomonas vulcanisoli TaxID=1658060 RepID=A0ABX0TXJ7_9SPHN|nr:SUF system Fe-S cluster assembly regulator [Sphingomonas vulcanisoli]NIJ09177.1 FeS assembly SUF system regulator [Sphingomonas vulcanisoli]